MRSTAIETETEGSDNAVSVLLSVPHHQTSPTQTCRSPSPSPIQTSKTQEPGSAGDHVDVVVVVYLSHTHSKNWNVEGKDG